LCAIITCDITTVPFLPKINNYTKLQTTNKTRARTANLSANKYV